MTEFTPVSGALGGAFIGLSAVVLMGGIGRIAGVSGIFGRMLSGRWSDEGIWRPLFVLGLIAGAGLAALAGGFDEAGLAFPGNPVTTAAGGLLVGFGTALGSGCTSGHGICGLARFSGRSLVATLIFMAAAVLTVFVTRHVWGA